VFSVSRVPVQVEKLHHVAASGQAFFHNAARDVRNLELLSERRF
jgi:hypothetical protein